MIRFPNFKDTSPFQVHPLTLNLLFMKRLLLLLVFVSPFFIVTGQQRDERSLRFGADQISPIQTGKQPTVATLPSVQGRVANTTNTLLASNIKINNNNGATATSHFTQAGASTLAYGDRVLVVFNDAGSVPGGPHFTGYAFSSDQGATFTDGGILPNSAIGDAGYPVLARNNITGRIYLATQGFNNSVIQVFRSDDHGVTWMPPVVGTPGGDLEDKEWIAVDTFPGTGNGNVYLVSRTFRTGAQGIRFYKSGDHGNTFGPAGGLLITGSSTCHGPVVVIGRDHAVYIMWYESGFIKMKKSTDLGATFGTEVVVATGIVSTLVNGDLGLTGIRNGVAIPASFRTNKFPQAVVNPVTGDIYVTYANDGAGIDKADIFFVLSANGGATWSAPLKVNDDITTTDQWSPTIAVMPNGQSFGIFYYSRQEDPVGNNLYKYYGRVGTSSGGVTAFSPSGPVSDIASLPEFGRDAIVNSVFFNDYDQISASESGFAVAWVDSRENWTTGPPRKDPNIYFSVVGPEGPTPTSTLALSTRIIEGGDGDGRVDANECNQLKINLQNVGLAPATGITSTLSTSTPGVTITQGSSAYPDLNPSATAYNLTDFSFCTSAGFICGSNIEFTLAVTSADESKSLFFSIPSDAVSGSPINFNNTTVTAIPDNSTVDIPIAVSGITGSVGDVILSLHLTHTFTSDLILSLLSPDGTIVELSSGNGGSGDNYGTSCSGRTIFDDNAATSITSGTPPFAGTFRPEIPLSTFKGLLPADANGNWILRIRDAANLDVGAFVCATLTITENFCPGALPPTVTINQSVVQIDPTSVSPILFSVVFSQPVTGFTGSDVVLSGTATGSLSAVVTGSDANYSVAVSGMTGSGTVVASIPAGVAVNGTAQGNTASTSTDNTVTYVAPVPPTVTVNQAPGQADPTSSSPIRFVVTFSQAVTGFTASDVVLSGTATGPLSVNLLTAGNGINFTIEVTGMSGSGTVIASIPAGVAVNSSALGNTASTSFDNVVTFNVIPHDLFIVKSGPSTAAVGEFITYTIAIDNPLNTPVENIVITDILPPGTEFVTIVPANPPVFLFLTPTPFTNGTFIATIPQVSTLQWELMPQPFVFGIVLRVPPGSSLASFTNTATVTASGVDLNPLNNTSSATTQILFPPTVTCPSNLTVNATVAGCQGMVNLGALPFVLTGTPSPTLTLAWTQAGLPVNVEVKPGVPQPTAFVLGTTTITATAANGVSPNATCTFSITVLDVGNPVITCPANITVVADAGVCYATLTNAAIGVPVATDECDASLLVTHSTFPALNRFPVGATQITWTATDDAGNSSNCVQTIVVGDNQPPVIANISANPAILFPPTHKMKNVRINYSSTDNCGIVTCVLSVTSNEPVNGTGDGDTSPDWEIIDDHNVRLRAERSAQGNGRIYTITITCTDGQGNSTSETTEVHVPHNISTAPEGNIFSFNSANDPAVEKLTVHAWPNPSSGLFNISVNGQGSKDAIILQVIDQYGRVIETRNNITPGSTLLIGSKYRAGVYYVRIMQGMLRKETKLIKLGK
jgi:uncharacterized repeat protein (TIGR01451 family)